MYCTKCGNKLEEGQQVCLNCGTIVNQTTKKTVKSDPNAKSKIAAGLLGIFLGWLGIHNFYLGFTGKAIAQLLISVLSCFILSFVSAIWGLIEGILILTGSIDADADGRKLVE
ncbi:MAG: TM2 domain-containing protein [Bacilli bacterium]|nr:TM2 domain-containing protein [Bacilli bacterium]